MDVGAAGVVTNLDVVCPEVVASDVLAAAALVVGNEVWLVELLVGDGASVVVGNAVWVVGDGAGAGAGVVVVVGVGVVGMMPLKKITTYKEEPNLDFTAHNKDFNWRRLSNNVKRREWVQNESTELDGRLSFAIV